MGNSMTHPKVVDKLTHFKCLLPNPNSINQANLLSFSPIDEQQTNRTRKNNKPKISISHQLSLTSGPAVQPTGRMPREVQLPKSRVDSVVRDGPDRHYVQKRNTASIYLTSVGQRRHEPQSAHSSRGLLPPAVGIPPIWPVAFASQIDEEFYQSRNSKKGNRSTTETVEIVRAEPTAAFRSEATEGKLFKTDPVSSIPMTERGALFESKQDDQKDFLSSSQIFKSIMSQNPKETERREEGIEPLKPSQSPWAMAHKATKSSKTPGDLTTKPSVVADSSRDGIFTSRLNSMKAREFIYTEENPPGMLEESQQRTLRSARGELVEIMDGPRMVSEINPELSRKQPSITYEDLLKKSKPHQPRKEPKQHQQVTFQKRKESSASNVSRQSKHNNEGWRLDSINQKLAAHKKIQSQLSHGLMMTSTGNLYSIFLQS